MTGRALSIVILLAAAGCSRSGGVIQPAAQTEAVKHDPDDPAIWIDRASPERSLILGTDKVEQDGALYAFGLDGRLRHRIGPLDRPNNVDIEYGVSFGGSRSDIAVLTERYKHRLRVYAIDPGGTAIRDLAPAGLPVLAGETGEAAEPMGIALYKRPSDEALFAIVAPKTGASDRYLWQYRLESAGGQLTATLVRRFGSFSRLGATPDDIGEIEAIVVDDALGFVYYSDERFGIRKYAADPAAADATRELAAFGRDTFDGDREGLAIVTTTGGQGFILCSDQVERETRVRIYPREGTSGDPHAHPELRVFRTSADATDGLDATLQALPGFPNGLLVMMNSAPRNFQLYHLDQFVGRRSDRAAR